MQNRRLPRDSSGFFEPSGGRTRFTDRTDLTDKSAYHPVISRQRLVSAASVKSVKSVQSVKSSRKPVESPPAKISTIVILSARRNPRITL